MYNSPELIPSKSCMKSTSYLYPVTTRSVKVLLACCCVSQLHARGGSDDPCRADDVSQRGWNVHMGETA